MTSQPPGDDWIVPTQPDAPFPDHPTQELAAAEPTTRSRLGWRAATGIVAAGLVLGVGGVLISQQGSSGLTSAAAGAPSAGAPSAGAGAGSTATPGRPGVGDDHGFGGRDGEQHVQGTLTAVGAASITVKTSSGTTSYPITSSTQILRNGSPATLPDLKVGDPVEVHVIASTTGGAATVERVLAGSLPAFGPGGHGQGPDDGNGPGSDSGTGAGTGA
jgi:hypothetical protein